MRSTVFWTGLAVLAGMLAGCGGGGEDGRWIVTQTADELRIAYGSGTDFPQYAALHLDSSYFRMNYGPESGWGTSVVLMPCLWEGGSYLQGAPVACTWTTSGDDLIISVSGTISTLEIEGEVRLRPPSGGSLQARVQMRSAESVQLDDRPGEAFKPVMLSSMRISDDMWDASSVYAGSQSFALPGSGWILAPPVATATFGVKGGTSAWKTNAPTVEVRLEGSMPVTGWVEASSDPNDDNVGFWAASDAPLAIWGYTIVSEPAE